MIPFSSLLRSLFLPLLASLAVIFFVVVVPSIDNWIKVVPLILYILGEGISRISRSGLLKQSWWKQILLLVLCAILTVVIFFALIFGAVGLLHFIIKEALNLQSSPFWNTPTCRILFSVGAAVLGFVFFVWRLRARASYGAIEVCMGIAAAWTSTEKVSDAHEVLSQKFAFGLLTASIYLIVRGFDNIHQGLAKEPRDALAVLIWKKLLAKDAKSVKRLDKALAIGLAPALKTQAEGILISSSKK